MLQRCLTTRRNPVRWISIRGYRTKGSRNKKTLTTAENSLAEPTISPSSATNKGLWKRPVIIPHGSEQHNDLTSFLTYAKRERLSDTSNVYLGTHYEYTTATSVARLGFDVIRTGKTSDFGIDLLGWWHLPSSSEPIRVLLQCKAHEKKLGPQYVRELEGSFPGAPAHWQGNGVLGFLVAPNQATKGLRDALTKSGLPLGFMQITREGKILQMLWNHQASLWGLEGVGVTTKFNPEAASGEIDEEIALTSNGRILKLKVPQAITQGGNSRMKGRSQTQR